MNDLKRYYRLMSQNKCWAEYDGNDVKIFFKRFDPETGEELDPEYQFSTLKQLELDKIDLEQQLKAINSIIDNLKDK